MELQERINRVLDGQSKDILGDTASLVQRMWTAEYSKADTKRALHKTELQWIVDTKWSQMNRERGWARHFTYAFTGQAAEVDKKVYDAALDLYYLHGPGWIANAVEVAERTGFGLRRVERSMNRMVDLELMTIAGY